MNVPETAPSMGAVTYIHKPWKFQDTIAGPKDLAGFIDPPEIGLPQQIYKQLSVWL